MIVRRSTAVVAAVVALATQSLAPNAGATTARITDDDGDVTSLDSGDARREPRVDILDVRVRNEAHELEIAVRVAQVTPLADAAWDEFLQLQAVVSDVDREQIWFWSLFSDGSGDAHGELLGFGDDPDSFEVTTCETEATVDESTATYVLTADASCLQDIPRSIRVQASMLYDIHPDDPDYVDIPYDSAPDDDLSDVVASSGGPTISRIAGADRIATAIAVSAEQYEGSSADAAVLVSDTSLADSIAGGPLAAHAGGPLLLTGGAGLDARVAAELDRAVTRGADVYLLGGTGVLSDAIATDLRGRGFRPRRLAGANRFETAVAVADELGEHLVTIVADGRSQREGMIASAAAASLGGVVVLSDGGSLPRVTDDFLANDASRHVAIGRAGFAAPGAERITGASAAELSRHVLDRLLPDAVMLGVVSQDAIVGSLAAVPHVAARGGGLLLTDGTELSAPVAAELTERKQDLREIVLYGGTGALSTGVADAVTAAVR